MKIGAIMSIIGMSRKSGQAGGVVSYLVTFLRTYCVIQFSGEFDRRWYAASYPDVAGKRVDLLKHYIRYGAGEGRNPNQRFDSSFYLQHNPDVLNRAVNPLYHYIRYGRKEGRPVCRDEYSRLVYYHHASSVCRGGEVPRSSRLFAGQVLIVAELSLPQCLKYRVRQTKDILTSLGLKARVCDWRDSAQVLSALQQCSLVIFYRVPLQGGLFASYFAECGRLGIATGYDIDDPVFDTCTVVENSNIEHLDSQTVQRLVQDAPGFYLPLFACDFCIVSTEGMRELLQKTGYQRQIIVRNNAVDQETLTIADKLQRRTEEKGGEPVVIVYATPSRAHQSDFLSVERVLVSLLNRYRGKVRLLAVGDLPLEGALRRVEQWVDRADPVDYAGFLEILSGVDINIVPLVSNTFNATKSNIKFLDAAAVGVPSVCAAVGDYLSLDDGEYCFLASSEKEWLEKLTLLVDDESLRCRMGRHAAAVARKRYGMDRVSEELAEFMGKII